MKRYLSAVLAATLTAVLSACGTGTPTASTTAPATAVAAAEAASATPTPTPTPVSRTVPDATGKPFADARTLLNAAGFYGDAYGKDGRKWVNGTPDSTVKVTSTVPAAGTVTTEDRIRINLNSTEAENAARAKAAADAKMLAARYTFDCTETLLPEPGAKGIFKSLKALWASPEYKQAGLPCRVQVAGEYPADVKTLLPSEKAIAKVIAQHGGGSYGSPAGDFGTALQLCAKPDSDYGDHVLGPKGAMRADAYGALALCPNAPHAALLRRIATTVLIDNGTYTVGKEMPAGTYRTKPGAKDCYWARSDGGGNIIDNGFIGFAPDGVTVTVFPGEGFESRNCPIWSQIG